MRAKTDSEYNLKADSVALPAWFLAELPEHTPTTTIFFKDGLFRFSTEKTTFSTIIEAYDYGRSLENIDVILDPSVNNHGGRLRAGMFFGVKTKNSKFTRLLMSHTTHDTLQMLKYEYATWVQDTHPTWLKNQNDWVEAYNWLQKHPAFWYRNTKEKTFDWGQSEGLKTAWVYPYRDQKKKIHVLMEHGAHVEPEYKSHYHDMRLDVRAKTVEKAYILLAKKVNKFFNPDGTERENVKYKKSHQEKHLDKVLKKSDKRREKESAVTGEESS